MFTFVACPKTAGHQSSALSEHSIKGEVGYRSVSDSHDAQANSSPTL